MKKYLIPITIAILVIAVATPVFAFKIFNTSPTKRLRGINSYDLDFPLSYTVRNRLLAAAHDVVYALTSAPDLQYVDRVTDYYAVEADVTAGASNPFSLTPTLSSSDTGIATVNSGGTVTRVSNGTARINATINPPTFHRLIKQLSIPVTTSGNATTSTGLYGYLASTLGKELSDEVDARIAGMTASATSTMTNFSFWSTENLVTGAYVWNVNCWCYGIDMTGLVASQDGGTTHAGGPITFVMDQGGVLITPKHLLLAAHYHYDEDVIVRFIKQDGTTVTRTTQPGMAVPGTDFFIEEVDSPVPAGIGFAKVFPANVYSYLPSLKDRSGFTGVPVPSLWAQGGGAPTTIFPLGHRRRMATVKETDGSFRGLGAGYTASASTTRASFAIDTVSGGDSGSPLFYVFEGGMVVNGVCCGGDDISQNISAINTVIETLSPSEGYSLTQANLSAYTAY